jgi:hypothetical protein
MTSADSNNENTWSSPSKTATDPKLLRYKDVQCLPLPWTNETLACLIKIISTQPSKQPSGSTSTDTLGTKKEAEPIPYPLIGLLMAYYDLCFNSDLGENERIIDQVQKIPKFGEAVPALYLIVKVDDEKTAKQKASPHHFDDGHASELLKRAVKSIQDVSSLGGSVDIPFEGLGVLEDYGEDDCSCLQYWFCDGPFEKVVIAGGKEGDGEKSISEFVVRALRTLMVIAHEKDKGKAIFQKKEESKEETKEETKKEESNNNGENEGADAKKEEETKEKKGIPLDLAAMDSRYLPAVEASFKPWWQTKNPYHVLLSDFKVDKPKPFGEVWEGKDGKKYTFDQLRLSDVDLVSVTISRINHKRFTTRRSIY